MSKDKQGKSKCPVVPCPPLNLINIDLQDYKQQWLHYCKAPAPQSDTAAVFMKWARALQERTGHEIFLQRTRRPLHARIFTVPNGVHCFSIP